VPSTPLTVIQWLFGPGPRDGPGHLWPRWLFLRALGLIFWSAFYSLLFQIQGLIGPDGILPADDYLRQVARHFGVAKGLWYAPTLLWFGSGPVALTLVCWTGLAASILLVLNLWPRLMIAVCLVDFLSFVSAAQDFSSYQSDGMLLSAAFLCLFFAPPGLRPRLGRAHPPPRASLFLLQWLWFTIYFESGLVKMLSGEPQWRHLTAMDQYYANGPLPNWIGWYAQQLPHSFHAAVALLTLVTELALVWMLFLPRRWRIVCFFIVTPFQLGIILTANLAFLNHLVLALGVLLLDDRFLVGAVRRLGMQSAKPTLDVQDAEVAAHGPADSSLIIRYWSPFLSHLSLFFRGICLTWVFCVTAALLVLMLVPWLPLPASPIVALEPFRIANQYGLFAVMTRARYEIEFQGSRDGQTWTPYSFRYKPQDPAQPPRFYAPFQPRFDWNLWFASLGGWREYPWVVRTEELLLTNDASVLSLFAGNPFSGAPPKQIRAVEWEYWFTGRAIKRSTGLWWRREFRGLYAPALEREPDGKFVVIDMPGTELAPP
jgi:lipase maturation factor